MKLVDVHAHLTDEAFKEDLKAVLQRVDENLSACICAGCDVESSKRAVTLAEHNPKLFATIGIHPEFAKQFNEKELANLRDLAKSKKVVAVGEIGLDYHYFDGLSKEEIESQKQQQKMVFINQIEFANKLGLPVQIHCRDAIGDAIEILKQHPLQKESLLHCYSGSVESAKILMKLGFSFSFGGVVTFSNAKNVVEVVKNLPIEKILLETDCPYLSPVPFRGKKNEPKNVVYVADMIAKIKGLTLEKVAEITTQNAKRMFEIC